MRSGSKLKITAMVPAKLGSTRLAMKNLAMVGGKPSIYYAIKAAKDAGVFSRVVVNAEDAIFGKIARRYGADFYLRPRELVSPGTKTDTVMHDFLGKNPCDIVAWVSPIAPLQSADEVRRMVEYFISQKLDTLMTVKDEQVHCVYKGAPVNYAKNKIFAQTQDLVPVKAFVYSVMMWRASTFLAEFKKKGHAVLCGKVGYFSVSKLASVIIKRPEDLMLADCLMRSKSKKYTIKYDRITDTLMRRGSR